MDRVSELHSAGESIKKVSRIPDVGILDHQKQNINLLTSKLTVALGVKFEKKNIDFDINGFKSKLTNAISLVFNNPNIPEVAKEKFKTDLLSKIDLLSQVTPEDINALQVRRNTESVGIEWYEQRGKSDKEKQKYYLEKILEETIGKYITPVALGLNEAFSVEKLLQKDGESFHKETFQRTEQRLKELDKEYGFSFSADAAKFLSNRNNDSRTVFLKLIQNGLLSKHPNGAWIGQMIKNSPTSAVTNKNSSLRNGANISYQGKVINIIDAYRDYTVVVQSGQLIEKEVRDTRAVAIADDVFARAKEGLGMNQLKSEFDHLKPTDIEEKMKNASFADIAIMVTQLTQITPILGDILGGSLDIGSAITGMSSDGAKLSKVERALGAIFGTLGITVFGGWLNRSRKAGKIAEIFSSLALLKKYLPEKMENFTKNGGKIPDRLKNILQIYFPNKNRKPLENLSPKLRDNEQISVTKIPPNKEVKGLSDVEKTNITSKVHEIQAKIGLNVPIESILKACEELKQLKPYINIQDRPEDIETLVKLLDLRPDFSFRSMPLEEFEFAAFPFNLHYPLKAFKLNETHGDLLRKLDTDTFNKLIQSDLLYLIGIYRGDWFKRAVPFLSKINEGQLTLIHNQIQDYSSIDNLPELLEIVLEKGVDLSEFSRLHKRLQDSGNDKAFEDFRRSEILSDFFKWIRNNPKLPKGEIQNMIRDIADGKMVNLPTPWENGRVPKIQASRRIENINKGLSDVEKTNITSRVHEIQAKIGLNVPIESILKACEELKQLKPHINILDRPADIETLVKLLDLRPDFSFHSTQFETYGSYAFPFNLGLIFNTEYDIKTIFLTLLKGTDTKTFTNIIIAGLSDLIRYFRDGDVGIEKIKKIIELAPKIPEGQAAHIANFLLNYSPDDIVQALEMLLSKGIDFSGFTQLNERQGRIFKSNHNVYHEFQESGVFDDFLRLIRENPDLKKGEIEKHIESLGEKYISPEKGDTINSDISNINEAKEKFHSLLQKEDFSPEKGLQDIQKLPSLMRKDAMRIWKERYREQLTLLSELPSKVRHELFDNGLISGGNPDEIMEKLIDSFGKGLERLSIVQRKEVIQRTQDYIEKATIVRKYADEYKDSPKSLISKCLDTDIVKIKGEVTMETDGANFTFFIHNEDDYKILASYGDEVKAKEHSSGGISTQYSAIAELEGAITLQNGKKTSNNSTQIHETAHADNKYRMPDKSNGDPLSRAKDEIIAYLTEGVNTREIAEILFQKSKDGGIYDYYKHRNPDHYEAIRPLYESELSRLIRIADKFQKNKEKIPFYLDLLAVTPARNWHRIEEFFL